MDEKKVLIVEDDEAVRRSLSLYLKHKGYQVDGAADGIEGLDRAKNESYDVVVSDIMMPNMNGIQFLEAIKELRPNTNIIMITGYADMQVAIEAMKKGAVDFITKPFRFDYVEQTISDLFSKKKQVVETGGVPGNTELYQRLERKVRDLSVMYSINEVLDNIEGVDELFLNLTELACKIVEATSSAFYLFDRDTKTYYLKSTYSTLKSETRPASFRLENKFADLLTINRAPMVFGETEHIKPFSVLLPVEREVESLLLAPLFVRGENFGALSIEDKRLEDAFQETDITFISMLLKKASLVIENNALYETIYSNLVNTLRSLVSTIEAKDNYTQRHSERVTKISLVIAKEIRCTREEMEIIQFASMLHDIGKIGISDAILQKKGRLTNDEFEIIKQHPVIGARILEPLGMLPHEKAIIRHHHERWDGRGYPDGLKERDIPFLARIVSLADAYDAMTSDRVYRKGLSHEVAIAEVERNAWYQFDGNIVKAFVNLCNRMGDEIDNFLK